MPHIIAVEYSESQRRQLKAEIDRLNKSGWPLSAKYDAQTFGTWDKLFETAAAPGLFVQRETVVVENAEILESFPEKLLPLVEDDKAEIMIILVFSVKAVRGKGSSEEDSEESDSQESEKKSRSISPVKKYLDTAGKLITVIKPEPEIPPWKRKDWLISLAKEQGFRISNDAAQLLADSIESQEELRSEILKLGIFADGREITTEDVQNLSFDEGGRAMMMFLDGVCANNPNDVARSLMHLRDEPLLPILAAITNRLRPALITSLFTGDCIDGALKAAGFDPAKKNYAINKAKTALRIYGAERIKMFMAESARLSFLEKTSRAEGWQGFEAIIWNLMAKS